MISGSRRLGSRNIFTANALNTAISSDANRLSGKYLLGEKKGEPSFKEVPSLIGIFDTLIRRSSTLSDEVSVIDAVFFLTLAP